MARSPDVGFIIISSNIMQNLRNFGLLLLCASVFFQTRQVFGDACQALSVSDCYTSENCRLDCPRKSGDRSRCREYADYFCRPVKPPCETNHKNSITKQACEAKEGCSYDPGKCFCGCDIDKNLQCSCACGGGPPPSCLNRRN